MTDYQCINCGWTGEEPKIKIRPATHVLYTCPVCEYNKVFGTKLLHEIYVFFRETYFPKYKEAFKDIVYHLDTDIRLFKHILDSSSPNLSYMPRNSLLNLVVRADRIKKNLIEFIGEKEELSKINAISEKERYEAIKELYDAQKQAKTLAEEIASELHQDIKRAFRKEQSKPKKVRLLEWDIKTGEMLIEEINDEEKDERDH